MAVFTEQEIMQSAVPSVNEIIDKAAFVESTTISPVTVAVTESKELKAMVVRFGDVAALSEEYGLSYLEAMSAIVEANKLDPEHFVVAVDEAEVYTNPALLDELANVVLKPQSENSFAYQFCEAMVDAWAETEQEAFLEAMVEDEVAEKIMAELDEAVAIGPAGNPGGTVGSRVASATDKIKDKAGAAADWVKNNKGKTALGVLAAAGAAYGAKKVHDASKAKSFDAKATLKAAVGKDKNWIGKKIASLRKLYKSWLTKANNEKDAGKASAFKRVAASIMNVIDALMKKLEGSVGTVGK